MLRGATVIVCRECGFVNAPGTDFCQNPSSADGAAPCRAYLGWADPEQTRVVTVPTVAGRPREPADPRTAGRVDVASVLTPAQLSVEPAGEVSCEIRVRNLGTVVDRFQLELQGAPGPWAVIEPAALSLFPDTESTAMIRFRPPRSPRVPAGPTQFRVRTVSSTAPEVFALVDGMVDVRPFTVLEARIMPQTSGGTQRAEHRLIVDNQGNAPVRLVLEASDPDGALDLRVDPPVLTVAAGATGVTAVAVAALRQLPGGTAQPRPFAVQIQGPGDQKLSLTALFVHEPPPPPVAASAPAPTPPPAPVPAPVPAPYLPPSRAAPVRVAPKGRMGAGGCLVVLLLGILLIIGLALLGLLGYPLVTGNHSYYNGQFLGITGGVLVFDLILITLIRMVVRFSRRRGARQALQAGYPPPAA
ncbi:MAG: hypothetical protein DLM59_03945 [Pseudonocardiales bacterium]|nr:MAG: hypothetical protein DLM59_03945 [Pseudonocardiales bacterium]